MEYISKIDGAFVLDRYFAYLETIENDISEHLYKFASNSKHYDLTDHSSLHDAWLNSLNIIEPAIGERSEQRHIEIVANFLGPFHDREITMRYLDVQEFNLQTPSASEGIEPSAAGHGDLLIHEIRIEHKLIVHELKFSRGSCFIIKCKDIIHEERAIEKDH